MPSITAQNARQSAWLAASVLPGIFGIVTLSVIWKLGMYFPAKTLAQYAEKVLGKFLGKMLAGIYVLFFLMANIVIVREFAEVLTVVFMPETPILVFAALLVLVGGYAVAKGLEVITRAAQFVLPLFLLSLALVMLLSIPDMELGRFRPLLEGGLLPIINGSVAPASWYGQVILIAVLLPAVNKPKEVFKQGLVMLAAAAAVFTSVTASALAVFGPELTGNFLFPVLEMARYVNAARFVQRMEILVMAFWVTGIVIKASVFYYAICLTSAQLLGLKAYKPLVYPVGLVQITGATFLFGSTLELMGFLAKVWSPLALVFELGLPLLLLMVTLMRPTLRRNTR